MRRHSVLLAALAVSASMMASVWVAGPAGAAFPGSNGRLALTMTVRGGEDIFTVRPNGTGLTRLTRTHDSYSPAYSPRGTRILYGKRGQIWVMRSNGRHQMRVLRHAWSPTWAPDGQRFAFVAAGRIPGTREDDQVFVYSFGTGTAQQVTQLISPYEYGNTIGDITWSSHGDLIAFSVRVLDDDLIYHASLFTVVPNGTALQQITRWNGAGYPAWAPGGRRLVSTDGSPGDYRESASVKRLVVRRPSGTAITRIPAPTAHDPAWSPNGRWIAYVRPHGDDLGYWVTPKPGLWLVRPDGSDGHRILGHRDQSKRSYIGAVVTVDWQPLPHD